MVFLPVHASLKIYFSFAYFKVYINDLLHFCVYVASFLSITFVRFGLLNCCRVSYYMCMSQLSILILKWTFLYILVHISRHKIQKNCVSFFFEVCSGLLPIFLLSCLFLTNFRRFYIFWICIVNTFPPWGLSFTFFVGSFDILTFNIVRFTNLSLSG